MSFGITNSFLREVTETGEKALRPRPSRSAPRAGVNRQDALGVMALSCKSFAPLLMPLPGEIAEEKRRAKGREKQGRFVGKFRGVGVDTIRRAGGAHSGSQGPTRGDTLCAQKGSGSAASWDSPAFASASRFAESGGGLRM